MERPREGGRRLSEKEEPPKSVDEVIADIGFGRFQVAVTCLCGAAQACDMLEIQFANLVSQRLQCLWYISDLSKSLVTSATFAGLWLGAFLWGPIADSYSRVKVVGVCMFFVVFYGALSALAPNFEWVMFLRFLVGIGIGGVQPLSGTVLNEFTPSVARGGAWFAYQAIWCFGGIAELLMAIPLLPLKDGWRLLALATSAPMLLLMLLWLLWLPESPRQCLVFGDYSGARESVNRIARTNRAPAFTGDFEYQAKVKEKGKFSKLFSSWHFVRITILCSIINFTGGFSYYGIILLNLQVPLVLRDKCRFPNMTLEEVKLDKLCHSCSDINYMELLLPTFADFFSATISGVFVERLLTRKQMMCAGFALGACLMPLLSLCMSPVTRICLFFVCRYVILNGYNVISLYTQEAYPTSLRATAASFHSSFSRVAAVLSPFVAQMFIKQVSVLGGLLIFSFLLAVASISVVLLPMETKGLPLLQTTESNEDDEKDLQLEKSPDGGYGSFKEK